MKNEFEVRGEVTAIFLNREGEIVETLIDTADLFKASAYPGTWTLQGDPTYGLYVQGRVPKGKGKRVYLHRYLMDPQDGKWVDHKNNDKLDNRRSSNLRVVTPAENSQNRKASKNNKLGVRGVSPTRSGKYGARYRLNGIEHWLGTFRTLEEAEFAVISARAAAMPFSQDAIELKRRLAARQAQEQTLPSAA